MLSTKSLETVKSISLQTTLPSIGSLIHQMTMSDRLQSDIHAVNSCLMSKHLNFNSGKCCYLLLSRKRTHFISPPTLMLNGTSNICNKTRRLIGILYRHFYKHSSPDTLLRLYTSFIRPHLEYATAAWDPFLKKKYCSPGGCAEVCSEGLHKIMGHKLQ